MTYYMRMAVIAWESIELTANLPFSVTVDMKSPDGSIGFLPAFESREAFDAAYPGERPAIVQTVEKETVGA